MKKAGLAAILTTCLALGSCGVKEEVPKQFQSLPSIAKQHLIEADKGDDFEYVHAVDSIKDPELKKQVARYGSDKIYKRAQERKPYSESLDLLWAAIIIEPDKERREALIDEGIGWAESLFVEEEKVDFWNKDSAWFMDDCIKYTTDPDKKKKLAKKAIEIYEELHHGAQEDADMYLRQAQKLREIAETQ